MGKGVALGVTVTPGTAVSVGVGVSMGVLLGDGVTVSVGSLVGLGVAVGAGPARYHGAMYESVDMSAYHNSAEAHCPPPGPGDRCRPS